jgi:hypothetical protein
VPTAVVQTTEDFELPTAAVQTTEDFELEYYVPFPDKKYNATNYIESICLFISFPCMGFTTKTLLLEDTEVVLKQNNLCLNKKQRRPYAQLGSVDIISKFGCCFAVASDLTPVDEEGNGGLSVGCGCDEQTTKAIVADLQERKLKRGNVAQIKKLEYVYGIVYKLAAITGPQLLGKLGVSEYTPEFAPEPDPPQTFADRSFDLTNNCAMVCGCLTQTLALGAEEATLRTQNLCTTVQQKREYARLGDVQMIKSCVCLRALKSGLGQPFSPGCGCSGSVVAGVVEELRARMIARGNIGQIRKQEKMMRMVNELHNQLVLAHEKLGVAYTAPADVPPAFRVPPAPVEARTLDVTNKIQSCFTCLGTLGLAGFTTTTLELTADDVNTLEKNNLDESHLKTPYAQLGSVDVVRECCCFFRVEQYSPGFGCDQTTTEEIARELQSRKVARGNIAQVRQLESMQATSLELDARASALLAARGVPYPPQTPADVARVFGASPPKIVVTPPEAPHADAVRAFGTVEFDVTNKIESCCGCLCAGPTTRRMTLEAEEMVLVTNNLCVTTTSRTPYAHLESVETENACCCCYNLPGVAAPGCGCSKELVDQIAAELQERKVKRGNIAQIKMQENMMISVLLLDAKLEVLLDSLGAGTEPVRQSMDRAIK